MPIPLDPTLNLTTDQLKSLNTHRLLNVLKKARKHMNILATCDDHLYNKRAHERSIQYYNKVKNICNNREHIIRKKQYE